MEKLEHTVFQISELIGKERFGTLSEEENEVLEASFCRILDLGAKSGTSDTAMAEISRRMDDRVQLEIARKVGKIEPTIVIITSILVGIVLITVMLPLIHIMSSIG